MHHGYFQVNCFVVDNCEHSWASLLLLYKFYKYQFNINKACANLIFFHKKISYLIWIQTVLIRASNVFTIHTRCACTQKYFNIHYTYNRLFTGKKSNLRMRYVDNNVLTFGLTAAILTKKQSKINKILFKEKLNEHKI